jgi:TonB family protein
VEAIVKHKLHPSLSWFAASTLFLSSGITAGAAFAASDTTAHRSIVSRVPPAYPELARRMHVAGTVVLKVVIDPDGKVTDTHIESGHPLLGQAAQLAVARWRFSPGAEQSTTTVEVVFNADK